MSHVFRLAHADEKPLVEAFMDANWGGKHPLIHLEDYFNFYYKNGEALQFAFAVDGGEILAVAGYIRASSDANPDIWVSIWCAKKGCNGVGLELMAELPRLVGARSMSCNNIRPKTMPFYTFLGYYAARLPHFYRLSDRESYDVARITNKVIMPANGIYTLERVHDKQQLEMTFKPDKNLRPHKDLWYLTRRYFEYPRQKYDVWAVQGSGELLVTRTVKVGETAVLRIVDYIGKPDAFAELGTAIDGIMKAENAEYADCYCFGISAEVFAEAGFCERKQDSENIIPNYLTPLLCENTDYYFFTDSTENFTMFKADGDQDRPNVGY